MQYEDLTIHQRISLKGFFFTEPGLQNCRAIMVLWDFKSAVNYFLSPDEELPRMRQRAWDEAIGNMLSK